MQILHELTEYVTHLKIVILNIFKARHLRSDLVIKDKFTFRRGGNDDLKKIVALHNSLYSRPFLDWLLMLYRYKASELISVATDENGEIVAYDLFMFEPSEMKSDVLHELYVGVAPSYQDQGIAGSLRKYSASCYDNGCLSGLSTLAPFSNVKALRSAQKAGYAITKASAKPAAYYLFRYLKKSR